MAGYGEFARVYDLLTENVPYDEIADYYDGKLKEFGERVRVLADIGCGTGNLTARMARKGYDMIGADVSAEMLSVAASKPHDGIQYVCQDMTALELYSQADAIISTLDSINHLCCAEDIFRCFKAAAANLKRGGLFAFDVNTVYKHEKILAENTFIYDAEGAFCAWQNSFCPEDNGVDIELDLFYKNKEGNYKRGFEGFREIALPQEKIEEMLKDAGFEILSVCEFLTDIPPKTDSDKLFYAAKKRV